MMRNLIAASILLCLAGCSSKNGSGTTSTSPPPGGSGVGGTSSSSGGGGTSSSGSVEQSSPGFVVTTADGRRWEGQAADIAITSQTSLGPPSAYLNFSASAMTGTIGVGISLLPSDLLGSAWKAKLDGAHATTPGLGTLSYYENGPKPTLIQNGTFAATPTTSMVSGSFTTDYPALSAGTFSGSFTVTCYVTSDQFGGNPGGTPGTPSGAAAVLTQDNDFQTPFCAPFAKLAGRK